jgi:hypothetical protein
VAAATTPFSKIFAGWWRDNQTTTEATPCVSQYLRDRFEQQRKNDRRKVERTRVSAFREWSLDQALLQPQSLHDFVPAGHLSRLIISGREGAASLSSRDRPPQRQCHFFSTVSSATHARISFVSKSVSILRTFFASLLYANEYSYEYSYEYS